MTKALNIKTIFEKNSLDRFTKDALLYQDIILFPMKSNCTGFKTWDLKMWLVDNNREFRDRRDMNMEHSSKKNTTHTYEAQKHSDRIDLRFSDLIQLGLFYKLGTTKAQKTSANVDLYLHTGEGQFIARILERWDKSKKEQANERLYEIIQSNIKSNSSQLVFISKLYSTLRNKGLLDLVFDILQDLLLSGTSSSLFDFFDVGVFLDIIKRNILDMKHGSQFLDLFNQTLDSLDSHTRSNLRFILKSDYEQKIIKQYNSQEWEDLWIKSINDNSKILAAASCFICNKVYPILVDFSMIVYSGPIKESIKCKICNEETANILIGPAKPVFKLQKEEVN